MARAREKVYERKCNSTDSRHDGRRDNARGRSYMPLASDRTSFDVIASAGPGTAFCASGELRVRTGKRYSATLVRLAVTEIVRVQRV